MAVLAGRNADIYRGTTGTAMTSQATTSLGGGVYQITLSARRYINPNASLTVLDGVTTVNPANYQIAYGTGKIILAGYTPTGAITVTGEFMAMSKIAQATDWTLDVQPILEEVQVFGDSWKSRLCVQRDASITFNRFYNDEFFLTNGLIYHVIDCYADQAGGVRWSFGALQTSMGVSTSENETIKENVSFSVLGAVDYA